MTSSRGLAAVHRTDDAELTGRRTRVWRAGPDDVAMANTAMANAVAGATPGCAVRVRGLHKQYRGVIAVDGIDLEIDRGEVFALLGPNGAGKTTTIEILEGNRRRDAGEITVRETVAHFSTYFPDPRDPDEVIEAVGLGEQARTRLRRLSGGQRRRVDVAVGIVGRPELLFLDEPTTGFDPQARRTFWELIAGLAEDGTTILLTTHYLDEAAALARRVAVIASGRVVAVGTPADLGRTDASATVSWQSTDGPVSVRTATPTDYVMKLAYEAGGEIPGLTVTRSSLEDRYLKLIGASMNGAQR